MRSLAANLLRWTADLIAPRTEYQVPINRVTTDDMHAAWDCTHPHTAEITGLDDHNRTFVCVLCSHSWHEPHDPDLARWTHAGEQPT